MARKARTAKQRAALRKAQLASARKRKGKPNLAAKRQVAKGRRRVKTALAIQGAVALGIGGAIGYSAYKARKQTKYYNAQYERMGNVTFPKFKYANLNRAKPAKSNAVRNRRLSAAGAAMMKESKRRQRNARYARISTKMSQRGIYNAGLPLNVSGRAFVAGRGGTYRR